ncbi:MAG: YitT family protein [Clostridiales bacterium]|nr:YitT family protein [Clostridiales bacterium]
MPILKKNTFLYNLVYTVMLVAGAVIAAAALEFILVPVTILDGGVTGVAIIIHQLFNLPLGVLVFILNIPFLFIGFRQMGIRFLLKAAIAMVIFSVFLEIFGKLEHQVTEDLTLAAVYGGILLGIGVGMVLRAGGCLDGTESMALLISKRSSLSVGQFVLICNVVIFSAAGFVFSMDRAMYSLITYFITSKVVDFVESGFEQGKAVMIITNEGKRIANSIYDKLGRTVTIIEGEGLISGKKVVLYCVVTRIELHELKRLIRDDDASAFMTISDVSEIVGKHIKKRRAKRLPDFSEEENIISEESTGEDIRESSGESREAAK